MLLIEISWPLMIGLLSLVAAGHEAGCSRLSTDVPKQLHYSFGGVALVREGEYVAITGVSAWTNAQVPQPTEFDPAPCARLIRLDDFARLWAALRAIDLAPLTTPPDGAFEHTPPDMNSIESLKLVVDNRTLIDWSKPDYALAAPVRRPLDAFNDSLRSLWIARTNDPVLPTRFTLSLTAPSHSETIRFELTRTEHGTRLAKQPSGKSHEVSKEEFKTLWSELVRTNALCDSYRAGGPKVPSQPLFRACEMKATVNGMQVISFAFGEKFNGRDRFDAVTARLDSLWRASEK
jgi:hypothetical protein